MPAKHSDSLKSVYDQIAQSYNQRNMANLQLNWLESFGNHLSKNAQVLDLGAGSGRDSEWLVQKGFRVTMLDLSSKLLKIAQQKAPSAKAVLGDMLDVKLGQASFDGVWANASLLYLSKDELRRMLERINSWLKQDGIFFLSVKQGTGEAQVDEGDKFSQRVKRYFQYYQLPEMEHDLVDTGFTILEKDADHFPSRSGNIWIRFVAQKV